jgi:hypothetical protein
MSYVKDPRVDAYLDGLPAWQREICGKVRDLVHSADPDVEETIKRTVQPYFVLDGNICALLATKDHVNVFLYDGAIVPDPEGIITAGHDNQTARTVAYRRDETINERALVAMFRQIIANNRAGGWRKLKARGSPTSGSCSRADCRHGLAARSRRPATTSIADGRPSPSREFPCGESYARASRISSPDSSGGRVGPTRTR